jgi:5-methylcytosine-specific restriction endonuclease McrA
LATAAADQVQVRVLVGLFFAYVVWGVLTKPEPAGLGVDSGVVIGVLAVLLLGGAMANWIEEGARRRREAEDARDREQDLLVAGAECAELAAGRRGRTRDDTLLQHARCGALFTRTPEGYIPWDYEAPPDPYLVRPAKPRPASDHPKTFECACGGVLLSEGLNVWQLEERAEWVAHHSSEGMRRRQEMAEAAQEQARAHEAWLRSRERATSVRQELATDGQLRWRVFARDGYQCQMCQLGGGDVELTVDHIVPVSRGGGNEDHNLRTLCRGCNSRKGARVA